MKKTVYPLSVRLGLTANCLIITHCGIFVSSAVQDRWKFVVNIQGKLCLQNLIGLKQEAQFTCNKHNNELRSCKHCCFRKAIIIKNYECVCILALVSKHARSMVKT